MIKVKEKLTVLSAIRPYIHATCYRYIKLNDVIQDVTIRRCKRNGWINQDLTSNSN